MKYPLSLAFLLSFISLFGQHAVQEINEQVWKPFIRSFSDFDTEAFMSLHSPDVVRLDVEGGNSSDFDTYRARQESGDIRSREQGWRRSIDLRFEYRAVRDSFAYETGYYRTSSWSAADTVARHYYGKFNVILKKTEGRWKILLDADHGGVTEAEFRAAAALEEPLSGQVSAAARAEAIIRSSSEAFSRHLMAGDLDAVATSYTEDTKLFPPQRDILHGNAAARSYWEESLKRSRITFHEVTPEEIRVNGTEAYDWGYYEGKSIGADGKETAWKGKYVILWKETAPGVWKMYADIWNRMGG